MGTIVEASAAAVAHHHPFAPGARKLADAAARACLKRADRTADELDLLINVGIYHDKLMNEPALASLIQEDIGANPEHPPAVGHGTFSFDIANGACGFLTGIQLVDGLLASGTARLGMVVASDEDPQPGISEGFGFPAVGGAVLLTADDSRAGFTAFQLATFPEYADLLQANIDWHEAARRGVVHHGRHVLTVEIAESYAARALECAESTVREFAVAQGLDFSEVELLVANASVPGFAEALARLLGLSSELVASPHDGLARAHTAAPAVALESARLEAGRTALFVSAGAGMTVAVALYRG
jgi:3-oxoacyl-[acyl-carrier-protein] synthase III